MPVSTNVITETIDLREKINAPANVVTMQVVEAVATIESHPTFSVVNIPEFPESVVEESPEQIDVEFIPEPPESVAEPNKTLLSLIAFGAALLLLLAIVTIICRRRTK